MKNNKRGTGDGISLTAGAGKKPGIFRAPQRTQPIAHVRKPQAGGRIALAVGGAPIQAVAPV